MTESERRLLLICSRVCSATLTEKYAREMARTESIGKSEETESAKTLRETCDEIVALGEEVEEQGAVATVWASLKRDRKRP